MTSALDDGDAMLWWQAYQLAEDDNEAELAARAAGGDDHARRQLAAWLADRRRTEEAIAVIRPLAKSGDDVARLWLARWLAEREDPDELRQRALAGDYHALVELAEWLRVHGRRGELRQLVEDSWPELARWLAGGHDMRTVQLAAELGDDAARRQLEHWLAHLRDRAASGNQVAQQILAEW